MSEHLGRTPEHEPATAITAALLEWQQAEIEASMSTMNRNSVLDNWNDFYAGLSMDFNDDKNKSTRKAIDHADRLRSFTLQAELYPDFVNDDVYLARQLFCAQIFLSGAFRKQCFLQATDAEDYKSRRLHNGPLGIDLSETVEQRLSEYQSEYVMPEYTYGTSAWARLSEHTLRSNETSLEMMKLVHGISRRDAGKEDSPATVLLKTGQSMWARLAVDYIVFAATRSGNFELADVPFRGGKSISDDHELYYPFQPQQEAQA
jgi:hypothetical protein